MTTKSEINPHRALELRRSRMTWPQVARQLTAEASRTTPFHAGSVMFAVSKAFGTLRPPPEVT